MKHILITTALLSTLLPLAWAGGVHEGHMMPDNAGQAHEATAAKPAAIGLHINATPISLNTPVSLTLHLTRNGQALGEDNLQTVHTRKVHILAVDESLTDYHHLHPTATTQAGEYVTEFTARKPHRYWVWADITPVGGTQSYTRTTLMPTTKLHTAKVERKESLISTVEGLTFKLAFDSPLQVGSMGMATLTIVDSQGQPFKQLQPIMGAFAHLVGFHEDGQSIVHIHPQGEEPTHDSDRGGPALSFHFEPEKAGFTKLFGQFNINGKILTVPFGVMVAKTNN